MAENTQDQENLSMEDILSSIKGILAENEKENGVKASEPEAQENLPVSPNEEDDVFDLSSSMIIDPSNTLQSEEREVIAETDVDLGLDDISLDSVKLPDMRNSAEIDIDSDPIYDPEDEVPTLPDVDGDDISVAPENIGLSELDEEILSAVEENAEEKLLPETVISEPEILETPVVEETTQMQILPEVENSPMEVAEVAEEVVASPAEPTVVASETEISVSPIKETEAEPVADVSEDIIDNFARMFSENKKTENIPVSAPETELGNGGQTLESLVKSVIAESLQPVVVKAASAVEADILSYARDEVKAQAKSWIDANLTRVVEEVVREEVKRVMAKVGS